MIKIYPSSAGFTDHNGTVFTQYESACPKVIMLQNEGIRASSIDPKSQEIGAIFEDLIATNLPQTRQKEVSFKQEIGPATISGRIDFITEGPTTVHECKSTFSASTARDVIDLGKVKANHLAQMSAYFVALKATKGFLHVGRFQVVGDTLGCTKQRTFKVEVDKEGVLVVDGVPTTYTLQGYLRWVATVTETIQEKRTDGPRPVNIDQAWASPCRYCPYSSVCDSVDKGEISTYDQFVSECKSKAEAVVVRPAKITRARKGKA
jgi:hypothetical protein